MPWKIDPQLRARCVRLVRDHAQEINNRPRRRLGYLTPTGAFARLLAGEPHVASTP